MFWAVGRQSRGLCWADGKDGARCVEVPDPAKNRKAVLALHWAFTQPGKGQLLPCPEVEDPKTPPPPAIQL